MANVKQEADELRAAQIEAAAQSLFFEFNRMTPAQKLALAFGVPSFSSALLALALAIEPDEVK